jgi:carbon monoxide dehydrogenase subunit G
VDLTHSFTVPAPIAETWRTFEDVESVAGCFPGAVVTGVEGDDFTGTCKVKLGPIAMVYSGTGRFLERDEAAGRFVIDAKGKDKRGNGTAGAVVTATFTEESAASTRVDVQTDLAITGKPAQFGRGVIEDISNKLLQQFVTCLQDKVGATDGVTDAASAAGSAVPSDDSASGPVETAGDPGTVESAGIAGTSAPAPAASAPAGGSGPVSAPVSAPVSTPGQASGARERSAGNDDALDLGATVLPVLARSYGPQAGIALVFLVLGWLLGRRRR